MDRERSAGDARIFPGLTVGSTAWAIAWAALALLAVLCLWFCATGGRVAYTMDSLTYRDAAANFLAGHPLEATNVHALEPERLPLLQWPPAYPALWAAVARMFDIDIDRVPLVLTPLLLGLTVLSLFWCGMILAGRSAIAFLVATVSSFTPPLMAVSGHAWSEGLFLPAALGAFAAVWTYARAAGMRRRLAWLAVASILIALANWTRYTGVLFVPLLAFSVFMLAGPPVGRRISDASLALVGTLVLIAPLWWRNLQLAGSLSGSARGGPARHLTDRLADDVDAMGELVGHSFFNFDMLLRAHIELPMLLVAAFLLLRAIRRSELWKVPSIATWLPMAWAGANIVFLLYARVIQRDVDLDYRMLAVAVAFAFLSLAPFMSRLFGAPSPNWTMGLVVLALGLLAHTGLQEAHRVHENYAAGKAPGWRARFAIVYRDLTLASSNTRALKKAIAALAPGTLVLTDYRALHVRYLTGARAYAMSDPQKCREWLRSNAEGALLTGYPADGPAWAGNTWASECIGANPAWRVIRVSGRAAHSLILEE